MVRSRLHEGGFTLRYPRRHKPDELLPMPEYPKLLGTFLQYGDWLAKLGIENVGALNDAIQSGRSDQVVLVSEAFHENNLARIANQVVNQLDRSRIILIAGPSSAGKTTTSRRLTVQLLALGISPFPLELDNYFLDRDKTPLDEDGKPDFETIDALDLPLLADHLQHLDRRRRSSIAAIQLQDRDERRRRIDPLKGWTAHHPGRDPRTGPAPHPRKSNGRSISDLRLGSDSVEPGSPQPRFHH